MLFLTKMIIRKDGLFMIKLGKTQTLEVARRSDFGVYLYAPDGSREDQVLLPKGQVPEGMTVTKIPKTALLLPQQHLRWN